MFYYLSFLRPPPVVAHLSQPIPITPQIANDLRTELCQHELDIYYRWLPVRPDNFKPPGATPAVAHASAVQATALVKLTTWREANAYKEVHVAPPQMVKEGQRWRLVLCTTARPDASTAIDLAQEPFGGRPFPVISMPILFSSRGGSGKNSSAVKQEQIERLFRFPLGLSSALLSVQEQLSFDLDKVCALVFLVVIRILTRLLKKLWDSGIGLSYWLTSLAVERSQAPDIARRLFDAPACTILELGKKILACLRALS